jgi:hypothetical protein
MAGLTLWFALTCFSLEEEEEEEEDVTSVQLLESTAGS